MTASARRIALLLDQSTQHELHDPAIAVVVGLAWSVDAHHCVKAHITSGDLDRLRRAAFVQLGDPDNVEGLLTSETERVSTLTLGELQRQHTHPDQVGSVNPFVRLGDHRLHSEQGSALRRPVT